ncbi:Neutral/alkaline nonlysosomal ceramidase [Schizopora paradoxa]|uniref:Neutral ceramidase n=1 Tax=Schizopora paradoxa TaxID=27342 RepID=A0A0H2RL26_9AGAM|nr:Neutral/alkaline nonlysosomal ceramidase [Schizopora paradoxa]
MGYADMAQKDTGLHMRQRSRAFIVADTTDETNRVVVINADIAMGDTGIRRSIVAELSAQYPGLYHDGNVALIGTHSHAGVGGYLENLLPQVTALGYVNETARAIVEGTVRAVQRAHESLALGTLSVGVERVLDGNINRSPSAYLQNPAEERAMYEFDQDKDMTVVRFSGADGEAKAFMSFYAVHGTSLYGNNTLVSGDNKGMAAFLYENMVEPDSMPGDTSFVAGFLQSTVGDTSPNTLGAFCESPGKPWHGEACDFETSTCGNATQDCHGRGPGFHISDFESNRIIGERQFRGAKALMERDASSLLPVSGPVRSAHAYLNMSDHQFDLPNGTTVRTCPPALGFSFAGGTTDGPGAFDFVQGDNSTDSHNPFWELVKRYVTPKPSQEQIDCQSPKPILLNSGYAHQPYEWSPSTVNIQIFRIGNLVILVVPGEFTTMAGRRMRNAIRASLTSSGILETEEEVTIVIAGPANTYAHYVTTREEYSVQRYEGASTLYGPFTLEAYIDAYTRLVPYLSANAEEAPPSDDAPPEQISKAISLQTGVIFDAPPFGRQFGSVLRDVIGDDPYTTNQLVSAQFVGANPRNNLRLEGTFLSVDRLGPGDEWTTVRSDSHPSTTFEWERVSKYLGTSRVTVNWTIEEGTAGGTYRLRYFGDAKSVTGAITPFEGRTSAFTVV